MSSPIIVLRNVEKYFEHGPTNSFVLRRINAEVVRRSHHQYRRRLDLGLSK